MHVNPQLHPPCLVTGGVPSKKTISDTVVSASELQLKLRLRTRVTLVALDFILALYQAGKLCVTSLHLRGGFVIVAVAAFCPEPERSSEKLIFGAVAISGTSESLED